MFKVGFKGLLWENRDVNVTLMRSKERDFIGHHILGGLSQSWLTCAPYHANPMAGACALLGG